MEKLNCLKKGRIIINPNKYDVCAERDQIDTDKGGTQHPCDIQQLGIFSAIRVAEAAVEAYSQEEVVISYVNLFKSFRLNVEGHRRVDATRVDWHLPNATDIFQLPLIKASVDESKTWFVTVAFFHFILYGPCHTENSDESFRQSTNNSLYSSFNSELKINKLKRFKTFHKKKKTISRERDERKGGKWRSRLFMMEMQREKTSWRIKKWVEVKKKRSKMSKFPARKDIGENQEVCVQQPSWLALDFCHRRHTRKKKKNGNLFHRIFLFFSTALHHRTRSFQTNPHLVK